MNEEKKMAATAILDLIEELRPIEKQLKEIGIKLKLIPVKAKKRPLEDEWEYRSYTIDKFIENYKNHTFQIKVRKKVIGENGKEQSEVVKDKNGNDTWKNVSSRQVVAIGVSLGEGLLAIDVDGPEAFKKAQELSGLEDPFPKSIKFTSGKPNRFQVLYIVSPDLKIQRRCFSLKNSAGEQEDLDFRYGYIDKSRKFKGFQSVILGLHTEAMPKVEATSNTPEIPATPANHYKWVKDSSPKDTPLSRCPDWVKDILENWEQLEGKTTSASLHSLPVDNHASKDFPIRLGLSHKNRDILATGIAKGGRNEAMATVARDAIGLETRIQELGYSSTETARELLEELNSRCSPPLSEDELNTIWNSAVKSDPTPCLDDDKLLNCIYAHLKIKQKNPVGRPRNNKNIWQALSSCNGELGEWTVKKLPQKIVNDDGTEEIVLDDDGKPKLEERPIFEPKTDFDFEIIDYLEAENENSSSGYKIRLQQVNNVYKEFLMNSNDTHKVESFLNALKKGYGNDLISLMSLKEIQILLRVRRDEYYERGGKRHILAPVRGKQKNGFWVFKMIQFDPEGNVCTSNESGYVPTPTYGDDKIPDPYILPPDPHILKKFLNIIKKYRGYEGFFPTLFVMAGVVAALYYDKIIGTNEGRNDGFPIIDAIGDPGAGKTESTKIGQSLIGLGANNGLSSSYTKSSLFENLSRLSCLAIVWDDPEKDPKNAEVFKTLFNGEERNVRGNSQKPRSPLIITSNSAISFDKSAVESRTLLIFFKKPNFPEDKKVTEELEQLKLQASGAFSTLLKFGYNREEIAALEDEIYPHLTGQSKKRISKSIALLTFYALKLAEFCDLSKEEVMEYVKQTLCPDNSKPEAISNSLDDFLYKLTLLQIEGHIGPWNYEEFEASTEKEIRFILDSCWDTFDKYYGKSVDYDKKVVESLLLTAKDAKGKRRAESKTHKFVENKDVYKAWQAKKAQDPGSVSENCRKSKNNSRAWCVHIPNSLEKRLQDEIEERSINIQQPFSSDPIYEVLSSPIQPPDMPIQTPDIPIQPPNKLPFQVGDQVYVNGTQNFRTITEIKDGYATTEDDQKISFKYPLANLKLVNKKPNIGQTYKNRINRRVFVLQKTEEMERDNVKDIKCYGYIAATGLNEEHWFSELDEYTTPEKAQNIYNEKQSTSSFQINDQVTVIKSCKRRLNLVVGDTATILSIHNGKIQIELPNQEIPYQYQSLSIDEAEDYIQKIN